MFKKSSVVLIIVISTLLGAMNVFASSYHTGGSKTFGSSVTSVYSDIYLNNFPAVYSPSASCGWVMLANSSNWVQVGWVKDNGYSPNLTDNQVQYFFQSSNPQWTIESGTGPAANTTHGYRVRLDSTFNVYRGYVDDVEIGFSSNTFTSTTVQYAEEIASQTNPTSAQFGGTTNYKSIFSNVRAFYNNVIYYSPSLAFVKEAPGCGNYDTANYTVGNSSSFFKVWDIRY